MWQDDFKAILEAEFKRLVAKNPSFSLRAFAKKLSMSPGAVSDLINGKRRISPAKLAVILHRLNVADEISTSLVEKAKVGRNVGRVLLPEQATKLISNWIYFAIISVYESHRPAAGMADLADRLGITLGEAEAAVSDLLELNFLRRNTDGTLLATGISWRTEDGVSMNKANLAFHKDGLELSRKALEKIPAAKRDFTSLTFSAKAENLEKARKEIRKFRDRMVKIFSSDQTDSVFRFNVSLFPIDSWERWEKEGDLKS